MSILDEIRVAGGFGDMNDTQLITTLHQQYAPKMPIADFADRFGVKLPTRPSPLFSFVPNFAEEGIRDAQVGTNVLLNALGFQGDKETASRVSELERRKAEIAPDKEGWVGKGLAAIEEASKEGPLAAAKAIGSNLQVVPYIIGKSAASFLPDIVMGAALGGVAAPIAKAVATRLAISKIAPEALAAGAKVSGLALGTGVGSAKTEFGAEVLEVLRDSGVDLTSNSAFLKGLQDPELMARAKEQGALKGITVGIFDALSMGIAGRILDPALEVARLAGKPISKATLAGRGAAELGVQAGLGAAGEGLGQLAARGKIDNPASVMLEAIAELGTGPAEAYANIRTANKQREEATLRQEAEKTKSTGTLSPEHDRIAEERRIAEKSADIALLEDSSRPEPQERKVREVDWLGRPIDAAVEPEIKTALAQAYNLRGEEFKAVQELNTQELKTFGEAALQDNPALADKIPQLVPWLQGNVDANAGVQTFAKAQVLALPPPSPPSPDRQTYSTPVGELTTAQADEVIGKVADHPSLKAVLDADLSPTEKRQQALSIIFAPDNQQVRTGSTEVVPGPRKEGFAYPFTQTNEADLDRVSKRGEVLAAADARNEDHFSDYLVNTTKVDREQARRALDAVKTNPNIKPTELQRALKAQTGRPLPLKPAATLLAEIKNPSAYTPASESSAGEVAQGRQLWGAPPQPGNIPQPLWDKVLDRARQLPEGRNLTVPQLTELGLTQTQAEDARDTLRTGGILQNFGNTRSAEPLPYSNVLSPTNALNFLKNEANGTNYGCL